MENKIYIIHENEQWIRPLKEEFDQLDANYEDWFINDKIIDIQAVPPTGIFYNRMSASSHTRGHRFAPEITTSLIGWLELHNRLVINGSKAIKLELSKVEQYYTQDMPAVATTFPELLKFWNEAVDAKLLTAVRQ